MKIKILSFIVLSSLLSACVKDPTVTSPELGARLKARAESKKQNSSEKSLLIGQFSGASFLAEKQIEALEVLRLALPTSDDSKAVYTREVVKELIQEDGAVAHASTLKSEKKAVTYKVGDAVYASSIDKQWNLSATLKDGQVLGISGTKIRRPVPNPTEKTPAGATLAHKTTTDRKDIQGGQTFANVFEDELDLKAVLAADGETLNVTVISKGSFKARRDGRNAKDEKFNVTVTFNINSKALLADEVIVTQNLVANMAFEKGFKIGAASPQMQVRLSPLCNDLEGTVLMTEDRAKKSLVYSAQNLKVTGTKFDIPAIECGSRPTSEMSRFLMFLN